MKRLEETVNSALDPPPRPPPAAAVAPSQQLAAGAVPPMAGSGGGPPLSTPSCPTALEPGLLGAAATADEAASDEKHAGAAVESTAVAGSVEVSLDVDPLGLAWCCLPLRFHCVSTALSQSFHRLFHCRSPRFCRRQVGAPGRPTAARAC